MGAGKNCLLFSLVVVIGLGIAGFIYKDKIIDYINYQLRSEGDIKDHDEFDTHPIEEDLTTKLYETISTTTKTEQQPKITTTPSMSTTKEKSSEEDSSSKTKDSSEIYDYEDSSETESSTPSITTTKSTPSEPTLTETTPTTTSSTTTVPKKFDSASINRAPPKIPDDEDYADGSGSGDKIINDFKYMTK